MREKEFEHQMHSKEVQEYRFANWLSSAMANGS